MWFDILMTVALIILIIGGIGTIALTMTLLYKEWKGLKDED